MKNILVTGATGFVGKHLVRKAIKKYNLTCLVRETSDVSDLPTKLKLKYGNLLSVEILNEATRNIDTVIHLAASVQSVSKDQNYKINIMGTKILVDACKKNKVKKIIYLSSVNATFKKRGSYGQTKLEAESIVKNGGIPYVILRPSLIYGSGDVGLSKTFELLKKSSVVPLVGKGTAIVQPVYVGDVVSVILNAVAKKATNKAYHIGGASTLTIKKYFEKVAAVASNKKKRFINVPVWPFRIIVNINEALGKTWLMTSEQLLSMTEDKPTSIAEAEKDLDFKPLDFDAGLAIWTEEVKPHESFASAR